MKSDGVRNRARGGENAGLDKFFQAVMERRIADAEKELDSVCASIPATEATKGSVKACEGLLLTAKANSDRFLYLSKIEKTQKELKMLRKEFAAQAASTLHTDYDRGYFQVLESYMKKLEHFPPQHEIQTNESRPNDK